MWPGELDQRSGRQRKSNAQGGVTCAGGSDKTENGRNPGLPSPGMARTSSSLGGPKRGNRLRRRFGIGAALAALLLVIGLGIGAVLRDDGTTTEAVVETAATAPFVPETTVAAATTTTLPAPVCPPADGSAPQVRAFTGPPPSCLTAGATYSALVTTSEGPFTISLDTANAPQTVNSFVYLARNRFYDGLPFHRMIRDFVVQTGSPNGADDAGPGYTTPDEVPAGDTAPRYEVGTVAMGLGAPGTNGSQFFVVSGSLGDQFLGRGYTLFGKVTDGLAVISKLNDLASEADATGGAQPPSKPVTVESIRITETSASPAAPGDTVAADTVAADTAAADTAAA